jgi:5-hydroxyisourate hydrolase-like protein (transthyretin family)
MALSGSADQGRACRRAGFRAALAVVLVGAWSAVGPYRSLFAAEDSGILAGRVVDTSGRAVVGARVWALVGAEETCKAVAETVTGEDGRFLFIAFWNDSGRPGFYTVNLLARDRSGRTGWRSNVHPMNPLVDPIEVAESVEFRGRLIDQAGRPIGGVEVLPTMFSRLDSVYLSHSVALRHAAKTDRDGAFTLQYIPEQVAITVRIGAPAFGSPSIHWNSPKPVEVVLDSRLGSASGRIAPNAEPGPEGRMGVVLALRSGGDLPRDPYAVHVLKETRVSADGTFRFDDLPPGRYSIQAATHLGGPYETEHLFNVKVDPGADVAGLELKLRRFPVITGRVVDAETGQGLAGVNLVVEKGRDPYASSWLQMAKTDARGDYRVPVSPGLVRVVPGPTTTHTGLRADVWPRSRVDGDQKWPDLKMARAVVVDGIAVDRAGRPVADAKVFLISPHNLQYALTGPTTVTRPDGTFRLEQLVPDDDVLVLARTTTAATGGPVSIRPGAQRGPLTLTLEPTQSYHIRGTVTNQAAKPIEGAKVRLWWGRYPFNQSLRRSVSGALDETMTDASGRFSFGGLWPGERYNVMVDAEGYGTAESSEATGRAAEEHDFGRIMVVDTSGYVAGTVVDAVGNPFPGAGVFNQGDAPAPVKSWTGANGRFRLDGLFPGGKYVFARANGGYRFAGVRIEGNARDLTIRLVRDKDPPSPWKPAESPPHEAQRALAERIVTRLWARYGNNADKNGASGCVLVMARIDLKRALAWSAEHGGQYDAPVRRVAAMQLAESDARAAADLLSGTRDGASQDLLQQLAARFARSSPTKAMLFVEEAAGRARAFEPGPERDCALARAGSLLARLGHPGDGRALIEEAAAAVARGEFDGKQAEARGVVAGALAPIDLDRAMLLIEPIKQPRDREVAQAFVAQGIAAVHPGRALTLAKAMNGVTDAPLRISAEAAYRLAPDQTNEARDIALGLTGRNAFSFTTEALGWLAEAVGSRNQDRSWTVDLIDRALALPLDRPGEFNGFGGAMLSAAWVAAHARDARYPDMESVIARVLATRGTGPDQGAATQVRSAVAAAAVLALTDPGAARQVLLDIESRTSPDPVQRTRLAGDRWLMAWALVDLEHAERLFEVELAALEGRADADLRPVGFFKMAEVLATPPARRDEFLRDEIGSTWRPAP